MIRVHVAAEKSISSAMEDRNVGKKMSVTVRNFLIRKFNTGNDINDINFLKL